MINVETMTEDQKRRFRQSIDAIKYTDFTGDHVAGDMSSQDGWLGVCSADTTDNLAPQPTPDPSQRIIGADMTTDITYSGIILTKNTMTLVKDCFIREILIWIDELSGDLRRRVYSSVNGEVRTHPIPQLSLGWNSVYIGNYPVKSGSTLELAIETMKYSESSSFKGYWELTDEDDADPAIGEWTCNGGDVYSATQIKIHKTDMENTDFSSDFINVVSGSILSFSDENDSSTYVSFIAGDAPTLSGEFFVIPISVSSTGSKNFRNGDDCYVNISTSASLDTTIKSLPDGFSSTLCSCSGQLYHNNSLVSDDSTAYGIDAVLQEAYISPSWDLLSD